MRYIKLFKESNNHFNPSLFKKIIKEIEDIIHIIQDENYNYQSEIQLLRGSGSELKNILQISILPPIEIITSRDKFGDVNKIFKEDESYQEFEDRLKEICEENGFKFFRMYGEIIIVEKDKFNEQELQSSFLIKQRMSIPSLTNYNFNDRPVDPNNPIVPHYDN